MLKLTRIEAKSAIVYAHPYWYFAKKEIVDTTWKILYSHAQPQQNGYLYLYTDIVVIYYGSSQ